MEKKSKKRIVEKQRMNKNNNNIIINHLKENYNLYFICVIVFIIGIIIGVILANNRSDSQVEETSKYINESITTIKDNNSLSKQKILQGSLKRNMVIITIIWILGLSFLGKYLLYLILLIYGITFGYTSSCILSAMPIGEGLIFILSSLLLQNIITIPSIIFLITQGIKGFSLFNFNHSLHKIAIRYSAYCAFVAMLLIASSLIESYISTNIIYKISKYL